MVVTACQNGKGFMKKSIILVTRDFPFGNAEESFLRTEFMELIKHDQVTILTRETDEPLLYPVPEGVRVVRYSQQSNRGLRLIQRIPVLVKLLLRQYVRQEFKSALHGCSAGCKMARMRELLAYVLQTEQLKEVLEPLIRETNADLIYSYWCYPMVLTAAELKQKYPHLKVITRFHGVDLYKEHTKYGWQPFRAAISEKCDRLVFACDAGRAYYLSQWGQKWATKSVVSYLGCPSAEPLTVTPSKPLQLVSCSNLIPLKRVDLLVDALAILPKTLEVCWHHIGDGPERERLMILAKEKLGENVRWEFCGALPNEKVFAVYRQIGAQLFLTASATEGGVPVSLQECAAMGIPCIGTAVGGIPEIIADGKTGYLLPADATAEQIRDAIVRFHELTVDDRLRMHNQIRELWQEQFDARANARGFVQMVQELLVP